MLLVTESPVLRASGHSTAFILPWHLADFWISFCYFLSLVSFCLPRNPGQSPLVPIGVPHPHCGGKERGWGKASGENEIWTMTHWGRRCVEWEANRVPGALFAPTCSTPLTSLLLLMKNLLHNDLGKRRASPWSHWNKGGLALGFTEKVGKGTKKLKTVEDIQVLPHRTRGSRGCQSYNKERLRTWTKASKTYMFRLKWPSLLWS